MELFLSIITALIALLCLGGFIYAVYASEKRAIKEKKKAKKQQIDKEVKKLEIKQSLSAEYEFFVAGTTFGSRQKKIRTITDYALQFESGDGTEGTIHFDLSREPDNQHDPNAIAISATVEYSKEKYNGDLSEPKFKNIGLIGYVPAEDAKEIAPLMDAGYIIYVSNTKIKEFYSEQMEDDILSVHLDIAIEPTPAIIEAALKQRS